MNIKIGFEFGAKGLRNCFFGIRKYDPKAPSVLNMYKGKAVGDNIWLFTEDIKEKNFSNWFQPVFLQLVSPNVKDTEFFKLLKRNIVKVYHEIENINLSLNSSIK
jgi:hypothetical protein